MARTEGDPNVLNRNAFMACSSPHCLVHEVNAGGEPRVEDDNYVGTGLCRQIMLRLVHVGFLLSGHPPHPGMDRHDLAGLESMAQACGTRYLLHSYGTIGTATCCGTWMLDRHNACSVPTLDPARCAPALVCGITLCAAGDRL